MKENFKKTNIGKRVLALFMTMVMAFGVFSPVIGLADVEISAVDKTNTTATVRLNGKALTVTEDEADLNALGLKANDITFSVATITGGKSFQASSDLVSGSEYTLTVGANYKILAASYKVGTKTAVAITPVEGVYKFTPSFTSGEQVVLDLDIVNTTEATNTIADVTVDGVKLNLDNAALITALDLVADGATATDVSFKSVYTKDIKNLNRVFQTESNLISEKEYILTVGSGYSIKKVTGKYDTSSTPAKDLTVDGLGFTTPADVKEIRLDIEVVSNLAAKSTAKIVVEGETEGKNITGLNITNGAALGDFNSTTKVFPINGLAKNKEYSVSLNNPHYAIKTISAKQGDANIVFTSSLNSFKTKVNSTEAVELIVTVAPTNLVRVSGSNRFSTSLEIAKEAYGTKVKNIVIASGTDKASVDALAVGPLANELKAPILLVGDTVDASILSYIKNSGVEKIFIAGGTGSVSEDVLNQILKIAKLENKDAIRLAGDNRYATSLEIAKELWNKHSYNKTVLLAHGTITADALAASTYATQEKYPIILSDSVALNSDVKAGLSANNVTTIIPVGGEKTLPDSVIKNASFTLGARIAGSNREETSIAIANKLNTKNSVVIANGYKGSVDALAAASLAQVKKAPIVLTGSSLIDSQKTLIESVNGGKRYQGYVVGGENSVSIDIFSTVNSLIANLSN